MMQYDHMKFAENKTLISAEKISDLIFTFGATFEL